MSSRCVFLHLVDHVSSFCSYLHMTSTHKIPDRLLMSTSSTAAASSRQMLWHEIGTRGIPCSHVGQLHRAWHVPKCRDVRPARADINSRHELLMAKDDGQHACSELGFLPARSCRSNSAGLAAPL